MAFLAGVFDEYTSVNIGVPSPAVVPGNTYPDFGLPNSYEAVGFIGVGGVDGYAYDMQFDIAIGPNVGSPGAFVGPFVITVEWTHKVYEPEIEGGLLLLEQTVVHTITINTVTEHGDGNWYVDDVEYSEVISTPTVDGKARDDVTIWRDGGASQDSDDDGLTQTNSNDGAILTRQFQSAPYRTGWLPGTGVFAKTAFSISPSATSWFEGTLRWIHGDYAITLIMPVEWDELRDENERIRVASQGKRFDAEIFTNRYIVTEGLKVYSAGYSPAGVAVDAAGVFYLANNGIAILRSGTGLMGGSALRGTLTEVREPRIVFDAQRGVGYLAAQNFGPFDGATRGIWRLWRTTDFFKTVDDMGEIFSNDYKKVQGPIALKDGRIAFCAIQRGTLNAYLKIISIDTASGSAVAVIPPDSEATLIGEVSGAAQTGYLVQRPGADFELYFFDGLFTALCTTDMGRTAPWPALT